MSKSFTVNLNKLAAFSKKGIFSKVVVKGENSNHTLMCLAKGSGISTHTSTREATVTVISGTGTFVLKGKKIPLKPGVFIFMPKNAPHSLSAKEDLSILLSLYGK